MKEKVGCVFDIAKDNKPLPGCTISKCVHEGENSILYFSLGAHTDISAEIFPYHKLLYVNQGEILVYGDFGESICIKEGESLITPTDIPVGIKTDVEAVYTEIEIRRNDKMNEVIKAGEVFKLGEMLPYQDDKIVNMDVVSNDKMKFVVMAFDAGCGLSEHAAPGEAIIFALDGEGIIGYEGKEYPIKAGENFHFAKNGLHSVKATSKFKMALLLTLDN